MAILEIGNIVLGIFDRLFPNQESIKKADIELKKVVIDAELRSKLAEYGLLEKQADTNIAEASNPNRKWITWREGIGYACMTAVWYMWIIQPVIIVMSHWAGSPLKPDDLVQINVFDVLTLTCGMLGISYTPSAIQGLANIVKHKGKT